MLFLGDLLTGLSVAAAGVAFLQSVSMAALCSLVISRAFSKRSLATFLATCKQDFDLQVEFDLILDVSHAQSLRQISYVLAWFFFVKPKQPNK